MKSSIEYLLESLGGNPVLIELHIQLVVLHVNRHAEEAK
jgi:hypothetical protein